MKLHINQLAPNSVLESIFFFAGHSIALHKLHTRNASSLANICIVWSWYLV